MDELLRGCTDPKDILGEDGLLKQLQKRLIERALAAELIDHLGDEPSARSQEGTHRRNGKAKKVIQTDSAQFQIEVPRDRDASYEPQIVKKRQRRLPGFDETVLAFYAQGQSTREIQAQLEELYGIDVSPTLISNVTEAVHEEVQAWHSRPLATVYPILYFDARVVKSREDGAVKNQALYLALSRIAKKWTRPIRDWKAALNQFVILFADRVPIITPVTQFA